MDEASASVDTANAVPGRVGRHRAGLAATAILVAVVLAALPFAIRSMAVQLFGRQQDALYDLMTNAVVPPNVGALDGPQRNYFNIAVVAIDETTGTATLAVSGNRECPGACPAATVTLFALDDNAAQRRGLPPSASITLEPTDLVFSESVATVRVPAVLVWRVSFVQTVAVVSAVEPAAASSSSSPQAASSRPAASASTARRDRRRSRRMRGPSGRGVRRAASVPVTPRRCHRPPAAV